MDHNFFGMKKLSTLLFAIALSSVSLANDCHVNPLLKSEELSLHDHYVIELRKKGIVVLENLELESAFEYDKILHHNFDKYRREISRTTVKLVNGFKVELLSFNELIAEEINYDEPEYLKKQGEVVGSQAIQTIVRVDIGLGKTTPIGESWKSE